MGGDDVCGEVRFEVRVTDAKQRRRAAVGTEDEPAAVADPSANSCSATANG